MFNLPKYVPTIKNKGLLHVFQRKVTGQNILHFQLQKQITFNMILENFLDNKYIFV